MNCPRCRCAKEPGRRAGVIGINMAWRPIEGVVHADGAYPRWARVDRKNPRHRRRRPKVPCRATNDSDLLQPTRLPGEARCVFFCLKVIWVFLFSFVRPTLKMSRAPRRP